MNTLVLVILGFALLVQIVALYLVSRPMIEMIPDEPGAVQIDANPRARRAGSILAIVGVVIATAGSTLSLWAPGFS